MKYIYLLEQVPYYDSINQSYRHIITINHMATGPLKTRIRRINTPPLSPFQSGQQSVCCPQKTCALAILDMDGQLMCTDQLPELFQYLVQHNYIIDYQLSTLMEKSPVKMSNPVICYVMYET